MSYPWYKYPGTYLELDSSVILIASNLPNSSKGLRETSFEFRQRTKIR
jgi:hypothetical protein